MLYPVVLHYKGAFPDNEEELVFASAFLPPEERLAMAFAALPIAAGFMGEKSGVRVRIDSSIRNGLVDFDQPLGAERLEKLRELSPWFLDEGFEGRVQSLKPSHGCLYALQASAAAHTGRFAMQMSRIMGMVGIDAYVDGGRLYLVNPQVVKGFKTPPSKGNGREGALDPLRPEEMPATYEELIRCFAPIGANWAGGESLFVRPYARKGRKAAALVCKKALFPEATLEEYVALRLAKAAGANVPESRLIRWNDADPVLVSAYQGSVDYRAFWEQGLPPVIQYRMARALERERIIAALLGHHDCHDGNYIICKEKPVLIDAGGCLRRGAGGDLKDSERWGLSVGARAFVHDLSGEERGALSPQESLQVVEGIAAQKNRILEEIDATAKEIRQRGFAYAAYGKAALRENVYDVFCARQDRAKEVFARQAFFAKAAIA